MAHFHLYTSNRLEFLAQALGNTLSTPLDPMTSEIILVQSGGMQRWLSMHLARQNGILANVRFPFPVAFAYELAQLLLDDLPPEYALSQERMLWRMVELLPDLAQNPEFAPIKAYLADADPLKLVQLAEKITYHFDQYLIFRPQWSKQWEQGQLCGDFQEKNQVQTEAWQAALWQKIAQGFEQTHRAALVQRTTKALLQGQGQDNLPARLSIFGIPTLPPSYLDLFLALGQRVPVNIFVLSPCRHYWGDLAGKREQRRDYHLLTQGKVPSIPRPEDNTLLASLGTLGQDFHELLTQREAADIPLYQSNSAPQTLLEHVHQDLLAPLRERQNTDGATRLDDASIQIHCCHGPMREMEVLRDIILDLLENDSSLEPRHILVMSPDIETYAPFIQAVFGCPEDPSQALPYSIADRHPLAAAQQIRLLLDLLEFGQFRFEASRVLALLESPLIRAVLYIDEADCACIEEWVAEAQIRWGTDLGFRQQTGLADFDQNTWESGLARLFLGYMTGPTEDPLHSVAPLKILSNAEQILLARLAAFVDNLSQLWTRINTPSTALQWQEDLLWLLDTFFPKNRDHAEAMLTIRTAIIELTATMHEGAPAYTADSRTILHLLAARLDAASGEGRFLTSGLTFCGLKPMRSIPFRVICLAGLSSTGFPRQNTPPGFDLMAASPRSGDRNFRDDDRYLFLESLISAREHLILTYPGLSQNDAVEAPPSVLVSELLDYLDSHYSVRGQKPSVALTTQHRLQAFHPDYFLPQGPLFSYSMQNYNGARALCGEPASTPFFTSFAASQELQTEVHLDELSRFLVHPIRYLLQQLRITPAQDLIEIFDEEPLTAPDGLKGYYLDQELIQASLGQSSSEQLSKRLQAWQVLPPGPAGQDTRAQLLQQSIEFSEKVRNIQGKIEPILQELCLDLGQCSLKGRVTTYEGRIVSYRMAKCGSQDLLGLWTAFLTASAAGVSHKAVHVAKDKTFQFSALEPCKAKGILMDLLSLYQRGQSTPIPLFPRTAKAFAEKRMAGLDEKESLRAAKAEWEGGYFITPEGQDQYLALAYGDHDPDWEEFMSVSIQVYQPLLEACHEV